IRDKQKKSLNITVDELDLDAEQGHAARTETETEPAVTGFGMDIEPVTADMAQELEVPRGRGGALVSRVERNSPAANAGVLPQDVILEVNRQPVTSVGQITQQLQRAQPGQTVFMLVWRERQQVFLTMTKK